MVTSSEQSENVTSSESAVTEEPKSEEMEVGTDASELMASAVTKSLEVFHNNKIWKFEYRDLNWSEKYQCIDNSQDWVNGEFSFSLSKYYLNALEMMIVESPIRPLTSTTIGNLDTSVVAQLITVVPPPADESPAAIKKA